MGKSQFRYRYPNNLAAKDMLFLWTYGQAFAMCGGLLVGLWFWTQTKSIVILAAVAVFAVLTMQFDPTIKPVYGYFLDVLNYVFTPNYYEYDGKMHLPPAVKKQVDKANTKDIPEGYQGDSSNRILIFGGIGAVLLLVFVLVVMPKLNTNQKKFVLTENASDPIERMAEVDSMSFVNTDDYPSYTITASPEKIDTSVVGTTKVTYTISKGKTSKEVEKEFTVVDTTSPTITFTSEQITISIGSQFDPNSNIVVKDNDEPMDENSFKVDSNVNVNIAGTYTVNVSATDSSGNSSTGSYQVVVEEQPAQ